MGPVEMIDVLTDWVENPKPGDQHFADAERFIAGVLRNKVRPRVELLASRRSPVDFVPDKEHTLDKNCWCSPEVQDFTIETAVPGETPPENPVVETTVEPTNVVYEPVGSLNIPPGFQFPPEQGPGASRAAWADAANKVGLQVPDEMGRAAIIEAIQLRM